NTVGPLFRPPGHWPPSRRSDRLIRARAAAATLLSRQHALRPIDEDDVAGHGGTVGIVGWILPRQPFLAHFVARAVANFPFYKLAARPSADRPLHCFRIADGRDCSQDRKIAKLRRAPLFRPGRTRFGHARQYCPRAEFRASGS